MSRIFLTLIVLSGSCPVQTQDVYDRMADTGFGVTDSFSDWRASQGLDKVGNEWGGGSTFDRRGGGPSLAGKGSGPRHYPSLLGQGTGPKSYPSLGLNYKKELAVGLPPASLISFQWSTRSSPAQQKSRPGMGKALGQKPDLISYLETAWDCELLSVSAGWGMYQSFVAYVGCVGAAVTPPAEPLALVQCPRASFKAATTAVVTARAINCWGNRSRGKATLGR